MHACCNPPGERAQISLTEPAEVQANCVQRNFRRVPNCYSSGLKTRPVGTFGKKYVDFGGIDSPASATSRTCSTGVARMKKPASARPDSTASRASSKS